MISDWLARANELTAVATGSTVWLAVTGLTRAGKTVFITSLVHNLLSAMHSPFRLALLKAVGEGRLLSARLDGGAAPGLPRFPYGRNIERMAESPVEWPPPTTDISEIEIDIRFTPASAIGKLIGMLGVNAATLKLKIVDYPGEWLLDLPLLTQSYAEWSRAMLRLWRRPSRAELAKEFLALVSVLSPDGAWNEEKAKCAHELYCAMLLAGRDRCRLSYLQPGRFVCPGGLGEESYLWFAPLDVGHGVDALKPGTLGGQMQERYDTYKREVVEKFYQQHFRMFTRQIVLVDVLGALLAGREAFEDTRVAIEAILQSFRYGSGHTLARLLGGVRIDKVLFAATKADHVPEVQRDHLVSLLRNMAALPALELSGRRADIDVEAIASVISTKEDVQEIDGHQVQVVVGKPIGSETQAKFFVGNVPARPPRPEAWGSPFLNIPVFEPPVIDPSPVDGIAHINLDVALDHLIGDRLR